MPALNPMWFICRASLIFVWLMALFPLLATGQTATPFTSVGLGHGLAGAGGVLATSDASKRVSPVLASEGMGSAWFGHAAVFVSKWIGVGVEVVPLGTVTGGSDLACCMFRDEDKETAWFATGRLRILRQGRIAIDAVGGAGRVSQRRETRFSFRQTPGSERTTREDRRSGGTVIGVDVPVIVLPHVVVLPLARMYFIKRGTRVSPDVAFSPSIRFAVGVTAGLMW